MVQDGARESVEVAIRRAHRHVRVPGLAILFVPIVGFLFTLAISVTVPPWAWFVGCIGPLVASWLWWSFTAPRWRSQAVADTDDLGELLLRAIQEQIIWPPGSWFERTELQSARQRREFQQQLRNALRRYSDSHPEDVEALSRFVDPWLYPGRRRMEPRRASSTGALLALVFGVLFLGIAASTGVLHLLYDAPISPLGAGAIVLLAVVLTAWGQSRTRIDLTFSVSLFLLVLGFRVGGAVARSYPWRTEEWVALVLALLAAGGGYWALRRMGKS